MPYSTVTYTADGTETDFLITWNYLDTDHIAVEVGGVDTTDGSSTHTFSLIDSTTVRVTDLSSNPITIGVDVKLKRVTPIENRAVTFAEGSALRTTDLNKNSDFLLYSMQEAIDTIDTAASAGAAIASAAAQAAQVQAEAALDELTDLYLGSKPSEPTVDNDGDALVSGALFYDTTVSNMKVYDGSAWQLAYAPVSGYLPTTGGAMTGALTTTSTIDGRDVATDGTALDTAVTKLSTIDDNANNYVHPTDAGNKHIPTGGTVGQILENSASGTAVWTDASSGASGYVTMIYDAPDTYTWSAPEDCTVLIQAIGAGGSGGGIAKDDTANLEVGASGGSGGGYSRKKVTLTSGDTLTFTVGAGGARETMADNLIDHHGNAGGNTTLTGPSSLSITANGGSGGSGRRVGSGDITYATQPTGGTASGGDVNITGQAGANVSNFTPPFANNDIYLWSGGSFSCGYENLPVLSQDDYNHTDLSSNTIFFDTNAKVGAVLYANSSASKGYMAGQVSGSSSAAVSSGGNGILGCGGGAACNISSDSDTGTRTVNTGAGGDGAVLITVINL